MTEAKAMPIGDNFIPYGPIPESISKKLSTREREIFRILMGLSKHGAQSVWVRQQTIAEWTHCHIDTVGRAIRSIVKKGFLKFTGAWHQGRHKVYQLIFTLIVTADKQQPGASKGHPELRAARYSGSGCHSEQRHHDSESKEIPAQGWNDGKVKKILDRAQNDRSDRNAGRHPAKAPGHARQFYQNIKSRFNNKKNNKSPNNKLENKKDKIYQQAVQKFVDKNYTEALKFCKIRQHMSYDFHLPTLRLRDKCYELMKQNSGQSKTIR